MSKLPERKWLDRVFSVFVGGINWICTKKDIKLQLNMFGSIVDVFIHWKFGRNRSFAFVCLK